MFKTRQTYSPGFRQKMVELVRSGRKPSELSKEFGCHTTSILSWVFQAQGGYTAALPPTNAIPLNALSWGGLCSNLTCIWLSVEVTGS